MDLPHVALRLGDRRARLFLHLCLVSAVRFLGSETLLYVLGNPFRIRPASPRSS